MTPSPKKAAAAAAAAVGSADAKRALKLARVKDDKHHETPKVASLPTPKKPTPPPEKPFKDEDLQCIVCFDFPPSEIYQCENGHLMCTECYNAIVDGVKPLCPTCRVPMSRDRPSRNRFAETVLALMKVACSNVGCGTFHEYGKIKRHETEECGMRTRTCKYHPIGCDWKGIHNNLRAHERICQLKNQRPKKILKFVLMRNKQREDEYARQRSALATQEEICRLMTARCRDIAVRDVVIERDDICNTMCSKTFSAMGHVWEVFLINSATERRLHELRRPMSSLMNRLENELRHQDSNRFDASSYGNAHSQTHADANANANTSANASSSSSSSSSATQPTKLSLQVKLVSHPRRKLSVAFFIMKGPALEVDLKPTVHKFTFNKKTRKSSCFELPLSDSQARTLAERESLEFRVGFVDTSRGHMARSFTTQDVPRSSDNDMHASHSDMDDGGDDEDDMDDDDDDDMDDDELDEEEEAEALRFLRQEQHARDDRYPHYHDEYADSYDDFSDDDDASVATY